MTRRNSMRRLTAVLLVFSLIFCLCACGHKGDGNDERECGVFVTVKADDIYAVSCGTENGSDSATPADGGTIKKGEVYHFDFAGDAAEGSKSAVIPYMICIYDENFNIISEASFEDDFSNMAKVQIVVTKDHNIIYEGGKVDCGGKVSVDLNRFNDSLGVYATEADVSIANNEEASSKINKALDGYIDSFTENTEANRASYTKNTSGVSGEIPDFSMTHDVSVSRGDSSIICFRTRDYVYLGTEEKDTVIAHNFDTASGKELKLEDVFNDIDALKSFCTENILISTTAEEGVYKEGFTSVIPELVKDGNWYLSNDGLVIIANKGVVSDKLHEFKIPYSDIEKYLNEEYMPNSKKTVAPGSITASFANEKSADDYVLIGDDGDDYSDGDLLIAASGSISNVGVYSVKYNSDNNSYGLISQLFYCSDLREGGAFTVETALEATPNILVQFTTPYGTVTNNLLSLDADGNVSITDPDGGNNGIDIINDLPFELDLNGDSNNDEISISGGSVNIKSGGSSADFDTGLEEITVALLHDSDCDGNFELFVGGDMASDDYIVYCLKYDGKTIKSISFDGEACAYGDVSSFAANKIYLNTVANILGTYSYTKEFEYSDGEFKAVKSSSYKISTDTYIVPNTDLALAEGGTISAGSEIRITGTDFESFVSVEAKDGTSGKLQLSKNNGEGGWLINGAPESEVFQSLPYAG